MIYSNDRGSVIDAIEDFKVFNNDPYISTFIRVINYRSYHNKINHARNAAEDTYIEKRRRSYNLERTKIIIDSLIHV